MKTNQTLRVNHFTDPISDRLIKVSVPKNIFDKCWSAASCYRKYANELVSAGKHPDSKGVLSELIKRGDINQEQVDVLLHALTIPETRPVIKPVSSTTSTAKPAAKVSTAKTTPAPIVKAAPVPVDLVKRYRENGTLFSETIELYKHKENALIESLKGWDSSEQTRMEYGDNLQAYLAAMRHA